MEHLPDDAVLILHGVTWEEYEQLLEDMNDWPGKRVTYYKGKLEIVGPSLKHEMIKVFIHDGVAKPARMVSTAMWVTFKCFHASTPLRQSSLVEPAMEIHGSIPRAISLLF
ncbi:MAG: hypothetical protein DMG19_16235 [Acidobacteria bacterium]|nr:MAG: hypothetical protein DMG19_16235 [Acidobacteriota bacterium]